MKAEHRKQLQTNALADRMGRLVNTLKQKPQKRTVFYVVIGLAILLAAFLYLRYRSSQKYERAQLWAELDNGHAEYIHELSGVTREQGRLSVANDWKYKQMNVGKAARIQFAWYFLWERGIKRLGADSMGALGDLEFVKGIYDRLLDECKGDPLWEPEIRYSLATIQETFAVMDRKNLPKARDQYEELAKDFPNSAAGQRAEKRAALLKDRSPSYNEIANFYAQIQEDLGIPNQLPKR
jgi:hypothetical protein